MYIACMASCTPLIFNTARDMGFRKVMYMVVSPHDGQRTNGTHFLKFILNFLSKIVTF